MFIEQINALKEKENLIIKTILALEDNIKEHRENLSVIRRGLKSMQRLQEQLCGASEEEETTGMEPIAG